MFILFYFILPFGLILAFRSEKMYIYIYIYKDPIVSCLLKHLTRKKLNLKTFLDVSMF